MYNVTQTFVRLSNRVPGVLYRPEAETDRSRIAVLVMHSDEDYLDCPTGKELASRGFVVLCANVMVKEGLFFDQSDKMRAVKENFDIGRQRNRLIDEPKLTVFGEILLRYDDAVHAGFFCLRNCAVDSLTVGCSGDIACIDVFWHFVRSFAF